jgi:hypothetical protein
MEIQGLTKEEQLLHGGANFRIIFTHKDLTETSDNTSQTIQAFNVSAKDMIDVIEVELVEKFDFSGASSEYCIWFSIGYSGGSHFLQEYTINAIQLFVKITGSGSSYCFPAADTVDISVTFEDYLDYSLSEFTQGEVHIYLRKR